MLFDPQEIAPATFPAGNELPSKAQDLLEELRFSRQRAHALRVQLEAEQAHHAAVTLRLKRAMRLGEHCESGGVVARRTRGGVEVQWHGAAQAV